MSPTMRQRWQAGTPGGNFLTFHRQGFDVEQGRHEEGD